MAAQTGIVEIQPPDAAFEGIPRESTEAIKAFVLDEINKRMNLAGRAIDFLNNLDVKSQELEQHANEQVDRVSTIVADLNTTKEEIKALFAVIEAKMSTVDQQLESVPELTRKLDVKTGEIDELFLKTDALLKENAEQIQANETKVNALYEKTSFSFDKITGDLETTKNGLIGQTTKLRDEIVTWSDTYAMRIETMVKGGDFK